MFLTITCIITIGLDKDLDDGNIKTTAVTLAINTGFLLSTVVWGYKVVTTGDMSLVPGLSPIPGFTY